MSDFRRAEGEGGNSEVKRWETRIEDPLNKCWNSSMRLATEVVREFFLCGPAGGRLVTAVFESVRLSGAFERNIYEHLPA
jgi:hypothetical protein